jgi:hypothetical protein
MADNPRVEPPSSSEIGVEGWSVKNLIARLREAWASVDDSELTIVLALLALSVAIRLLRLQPIEYYDDEVTRWHFVRQLFYDNDFHHARWTHHMARFGVNFPLFLVQAVFGRHARVYYIWPLASFTLQVLFLYLTAKRLGGRAAGVLAASFLCVFTGLDRGACQLLPDTFGGTAMILVVYLLVRYQEAELERRMGWLIGAGLAFVWAYEIKESNLLFLPGAAACVWLCKGRFRDGIWFCAILLLAIVIETAGFRIFTDYKSRFAIVEEAHGEITSTFVQLFDRFTRLEPPWQMLFWMWVPSAFWLGAGPDRRKQALVLMPATFLLLITFLVRSINPIVIWTRFYSRYFEPAAPLFVAAVALFAVEALRRAWPIYAPLRFGELPARLTRHAAVLTVAACCLVGGTEYALARENLANHPLTETRRFSSITNDAYRRNLPIVQLRARRGEIEDRRVRPLKAVFGIYLSDAKIVTSNGAKNNRLPDILDSVHDGKRYSFVLHDPSAYREDEIDEWVERGCAVILTEAKNHLTAATGVPSLIIKQSTKLSDSCHPPQH